MNFGPRTSETDSYGIMDKALDVGVNFFDTANRYGREVGIGHTEEIIGRWLAQGQRRRADRAGHQAVWRHGRRAQ